MIFWIILGVLLLLYLFPLGIRLIYSSEGCRIWLLAGPVPIKVYPKNKQAKKPEKGAIKADKQGKKSAPKKQTEKKEEKKEGGSLKDFLPFVDIAKNLLRDFFHKLRIHRLEVKMTMAGEDPCDLAVNYGRVWAATGNLIPFLEEHFVIKKRDVQINCDFTAEETVIYVRADITILLGRLLTLAVVHGFRGFREYLKLMKKRKGEQNNE